MPLRLAFLALTLAADPAAAICPASRAEAEAGVQITMDDGSSAVLTRGGDGIVTEDWTYPDGYRERLRAMHGVHAVGYAELDGDSNIVAGTEEETAFADPFPGEPEAGQGWSTTGRITFAGEDGGEMPYNSKARDGGTLAIGPCSYQAVTVTNRIGGGMEARVEELDFLPDLGIAILRGTSGGLGQDSQRVSPLTIAPGPP